MVAVGFSYCLSALIVATDSWPFILGLHLIALPYAILFHILLAFPSGRLETRADRALVTAATSSPRSAGGSACCSRTRGRQALPANPLLVADDPGAFSTLPGCGWAGRGPDRRPRGRPGAPLGELATTSAASGARAGLPQRRARARPVRGVGGPRGRRRRGDVQDTLERARVSPSRSCPSRSCPGCCAAAWRPPRRSASSWPGSAASGATARCGRARRRARRPDPAGRLLAAAAPAVGRRPPAADFTTPGPGDGRATTPVEQDGRPVAMLVHEAADEPELVRAVGGAAALALDNERLEAELRANVQELRASRARIVESADAARRRIERDLHDGAQQQLVALALALPDARAAGRPRPARPRALLDDARGGARRRPGDLRELARGIHPAVLADRGLGPPWRRSPAARRCRSRSRRRPRSGSPTRSRRPPISSSRRR